MFRYSICDPLKEEPIEIGEIEKEKIPAIIDRFPWNDLLDKMNAAHESDIYFSPSIEFENKDTRHSLAISIVEEENGNEFYIFFKRPRLIAKNVEGNYISERTGQTTEDVKDAINALITGDVTTLEKRWG